MKTWDAYQARLKREEREKKIKNILDDKQDL